MTCSCWKGYLGHEAVNSFETMAKSLTVAPIQDTFGIPSQLFASASQPCANSEKAKHASEHRTLGEIAHSNTISCLDQSQFSLHYLVSVVNNFTIYQPFITLPNLVFRS